MNSNEYRLEGLVSGDCRWFRATHILSNTVVELPIEKATSRQALLEMLEQKIAAAGVA